MTLWPEERATIAPPSGMSTEEWGMKNRELSAMTSAQAGPWSLDMLPFFRPLLAALDDDNIEIVCLQKSTQIAGSETVLTWLGKVAAEDPGPAMIVFADEDTAKEFCKRRIQPMFRSSPVLANLVIEADFNQDSIILKNGFSLTMAWASSIARTASRPMRYLVADEICKPAYGLVQAEGSVLSRIFQRTETFPNRKIVMLSSVTTEGDNMDKQMSLCQAVYDWRVPCPHCGAVQVLTFFPEQKDMPGKVWFPEGATAQERATQAKYQCKECKSLWTTAQKNEAVSRGVAQARGEVSAKVKRVGFHVSRLLSFFPGGRLEALAEAFLMAKDDLSELQSFYNNSLAQHWKTYRVTSTAEELMKAKCDLPSHTVPDSADCVIITADMQQTGFWYVVRAWSSKLKDSWLIDCGQIGDWEDLNELIFDRLWLREDGSGIHCWRAALDIGGTKEEGKEISRTEEAENWWIENRRRAFRRVFLCKGSSKTMPDKLKIGHILESTPSGKKIAGAALQLIELNTISLKTLFLHSLDQACKKSSGSAYLNKDVPDAYFRHILAEVQEADGTFRKVARDNHWLDCEMMQQGMVSRLLHGGIETVRQAEVKYKHLEQKQKPAAAKKEEPEEENPWLKGILK